MIANIIIAVFLLPMQTHSLNVKQLTFCMVASHGHERQPLS